MKSKRVPRPLAFAGGSSWVRTPAVHLGFSSEKPSGRATLDKGSNGPAAAIGCPPHRTAMGGTSPAPEPDRPRMSSPRGWNAQADEDLLHLASSGFRLDSMAWALNRSPGTIRARLTELHWMPTPAVADPGPPPTIPDDAASKFRPQVGPRKLLGF